MRLATRIATGVLTVGIAVGTLSACSSDKKSTDTATELKPLAAVTALTGAGQSTAVKLDTNFVAALTSLKVAPGVTGDATLADGSVSFPITGGNVSYFKPGSVAPYVVGVIFHDGSGITLKAGDTTVGLANFEVDPGSSKLYGQVKVNGSVFAEHVWIFDLDGSTLKPLDTATSGKGILQGTTVKMSPDAAAALNMVFKIDAIKAGLVVGIATITINTGASTK